MKTKISIFITVIALLFGATTAVAQGTQAYFNKNGVTAFQKPIANIDSIVFKQVDPLADEPLDLAFLEFLESLPVIHITVDDFDFEDINSLKLRSGNETDFCQSEINKLFFEMGKFALTQTDNFNVNDKKKLEDNKKQTKLAYIWGGKLGFDGLDWGKKHGSTCTDTLYGYDCSGFVSKIINQVGIPISKGKVNTIFSEIKKFDNKNLPSFYYNGLVIIDELSENEIKEPSNLKNGDIIFRFDKDENGIYNATHIGVILQYKSGTTSKVGIFQSYGYQNDCSDTKKTKCGQCDINKTTGGPIFNELNSLEGYKKDILGFRSGMLKVLRIYPKIFEIDPKEIYFESNLEAKSFEIKTSYPINIEEIKSLDENICTVQSSVFRDICGDTTIYTINVFPNTTLSSGVYKTKIVVKAKIKDQPEEKSVSVQFTIPEETCESFDNPQGVVINNVRWATRNVGAPGTFTSSPCDYGSYYTWEEAQSVCPAGWRVPTLVEIQKLCDTYNVSSEWLNKNGLIGRKFTDRNTSNSIFLPAAKSDGSLCPDIYGFYWSSVLYDSGMAYGLLFNSSYADWWGAFGGLISGYTVRPVAK